MIYPRRVQDFRSQVAAFDGKKITAANKVLTISLLYDTVTSKWGCIASVEEA